MEFGLGVVCLLLCLLGVTLGLAAVRIWRDPAVEPAVVPFVRALRMSEEGRHAVGRAIVPLTGMYSAMAVLVGAAASEPARDSVLGIVGLAAAALMLLSGLLFIAVAWFNWPRVLVPVHLRCEFGLVSGWWAKRRRDVPGAGK